MENHEQYCSYCDKTCSHPKQWNDHINKSQHYENVQKFEHKQKVKSFIENEIKDGCNYMILDLEGHVLPKDCSEKSCMIILEISYLIFTYNSTSQFEILHTFNSLVKPGKKMDYFTKYPSMKNPIKITMEKVHGLSFTTCDQEGLTPNDMWQNFVNDVKKYDCKYIMSKGSSMEQNFVNGPTFQINELEFTPSNPLGLTVMDLSEMFNIKPISGENLNTFPNCGHHLPNLFTNEPNHCSLSEIYCYYQQLISYVSS
jgi:hypothetical protein